MVSATGEAPGVNRLEIWGSKGKLTVEDSKKLTFDENKVSTEEFARTNQDIFTQLPHALLEIPLDPEAIPYQQVMTRFAERICSGGELIANGWDGLQEVQLANAVYVSGWEACRVTLPVDEQRYLNCLHSRQQAELQNT